jgi:hypothetical protein
VKNTFEVFIEGSFDPESKIGSWGLVLANKNRILSKYVGAQSNSSRDAIQAIAFAEAQTLTQIRPDLDFTLHVNVTAPYVGTSDCDNVLVERSMPGTFMMGEALNLAVTGRWLFKKGLIKGPATKVTIEPLEVRAKLA